MSKPGEAALKKKATEPVEARVATRLKYVSKYARITSAAESGVRVGCKSIRTLARIQVMLMLDAEGEPIAEVLKQIARPQK